MYPVDVIDNLSYTYATDSNKLLKVTEDTPTSTSGFKDGTNTDDDYDYDDYGNMEIDKNKGITNIKYNHLNLPTIITFGTIGSIEYIYNADGIKLEKKVTQGTTANTTKYITGFQYLNNVLQFFPHAEGYVAKSGSSYKYVFQYKDHLGNVRLSYAQNASTNNLDIIEESHYYPFGLKHSGYNTDVNLANGNLAAQNYKFQEQERQDELGLNWDSFKWRNYDPAIGRFMSIDPLAEKYNWMSCYQFASNQVIHGREIEGLENDNDLNYDDLDESYLNFYGGYRVYGIDLFDNNNEQIHTPNMDLNEVVVEDSRGTNYDNDEEFDDFTGFDNQDFGWDDGYDFDINNKTFNEYKRIIGVSIAKVSTITGLTDALASKQIIDKYRKGGDVIEALEDWKSLDKLKGANNILRKVGYAGLLVDGVQLVSKAKNGSAENSDYARFGINAVLTIVAISNPFSLAAIGAYAVFDYYYGDEFWNATGINN
jgi:RHS repeat-associated protein